MKMKVVVLGVVLSMLGVTVSGQYAATVFPYFPKNGQPFYAPETTTPSPHVYTETSLSPQTSVSVHHTIVRNKPAYPYPYTESSMQSEGSEDTSYYYTYEDSSEEKKKSYSTTPVPTSSSTAKTVRSFWNSQKAQLDARRKESAKLLPTYSKPTARAETRPKIEFKVREKPRFGQANKNKEVTTESGVVKKENKTQNDQSTTPKSVKYNKKESNSVKEKGSEEDEMLKSSSKSSSPALQNQIIGRVGEIPILNQYASQIQSPIRTQGNFGTSRQSKFDHSAGNMQYIDNTANYQQPALRNALIPQLPLANTVNQPLSQQTRSNPDPFTVNLSQRQQPLTSNQQAILTNQNIQDSIQALLTSNQQALLKMNQQPLLRSNQQQLANNNPPTLINNVQQPSIINRPPVSAFISASPAESIPARSAEQYVNTNSPASTLLQRLGSLGLNLAGGGDLGDALIQGRDGGYGPSGLTFNLGPVSDPLQILLKLLSLLPRPLLDLNGRLFFGIELGKNAGLVAGGGAKPVGKPIG